MLRGGGIRSSGRFPSSEPGASLRTRGPRWYVLLSVGLGIAGALLAGQAAAPFRHRSLLSSDRVHAEGSGATPDGSGDGPTTPTGLAGRTVDQQLFSEAVGQSLPYRVYLPPGYDANTTPRYPVLYLLHGLGGSYVEWSSDGALATADRLIENGEIAPLIIVLPEGEDAYWVDHADGGPRWGTYVAQDVVTAIDGQYRTLADRSHRAIGGMSMGGNGALQLAMNHADVFGVVGADSFALRRHDAAPAYFGDQAYFNAHDPVYLFQNQPAVARSLTLWLDVGASDPWRQADEAFDQQLTTEGIPHAWHEYTGAHEDAYWTTHTTDYLRFYSAALSGVTGG